MATETQTTAPKADISTLTINRITTQDLREVLHKGFDDFYARPTHVIFLCVIYPVVAILLIRAAFGYDMLPLIFPLISGFALVGPLAATGLYELSWRREKKEEYAWWHVFDVVRSPSRWALATMGALLAAIFALWLQTALVIYGLFFGDTLPESVGGFVDQVFFTPEGWGLIVVGVGAGFVFAAVVFTISVVSLPMLIHRKVSAVKAMDTSVKAVAANAKPMIAWGLIVVAALILGSLPLFIGLAIVMPVLGHSTWHLYRRLVSY